MAWARARLIYLSSVFSGSGNVNIMGYQQSSGRVVGYAETRRTEAVRCKASSAAVVVSDAVIEVELGVRRKEDVITRELKGMKR